MSDKFEKLLARLKGQQRQLLEDEDSFKKGVNVYLKAGTYRYALDMTVNLNVHYYTRVILENIIKYAEQLRAEEQS